MEWSGPFPVFTPPENFWADQNFWAPEVHKYNGKYYMFASFKADGICRGTQILAADVPEGPFLPLTEGSVTPSDWECLDGTFYLDDTGAPWIVFCHEWLQVRDGEICAMRLSQDLKYAVGKPQLLFTARQAGWPSMNHDFGATGYVTDGPFLYNAENGHLLMIWSSYKNGDYAIATARSRSGNVLGPWEHDGTLF